MSLETVLRNTKKLYERRFLQEPKQLYHVLFPTLDEDTSEEIRIDEYVQSPYAMAYRDKDGVAHIRQHVPGSSSVFSPPIASEKTEIDETLSGQVEVGMEPTSGYGANESARLDRLVSNHIAGHNMTKNKQVLDVFRTGVFYAKGVNERDIGKNKDYGRAGGNSQTPDFTAGTPATITSAFSDATDQLDAQACPADERFAIVGPKWLKQMRSDSVVLDNMKANTSNILVKFEINPPTWAGVKGLSYQGTLILGSMTKPIDIFTYTPGVAYKATPTDATGFWLDSDEAIFGSWQSPRWRVLRGVRVLSAPGKIVRTSGEIIFDKYVSNEPVTEFIRSHSRHLFLPANVNHTLISTGTFA